MRDVIESFRDRDTRLGSDNPRLTQASGVLALLEKPSGELDGPLEAAWMLLEDAGHDGDTYSLDLLLDGLHRVYTIWSVAELDRPMAEHLGEIRGMAKSASMKLERTVPLNILGELEPGSVPHRVLKRIAEHDRVSNQEIADELAVAKSQISRAGRRLHAAGLADKRRLGRLNSWEITPRGVQTLDLLEQEGKARPFRRQIARL